MREWKQVPGFPCYEVSNDGFVRNINTKNLLSQQTKRGYLCVSLYENGKKFQTGVHRIVALAFVDNPLKKPQVNHIDGNKQNNSYDNLEWCTAKENRIHAILVLNANPGMNGKHHSSVTKRKISESHKGKTLSEDHKQKLRDKAKRGGDSCRARKVMNIETGEIFNSIVEAANIYGGARNIQSVCVGRRKTAGGFHWKYID